MSVLVFSVRNESGGTDSIRVIFGRCSIAGESVWHGQTQTGCLRRKCLSQPEMRPQSENNLWQIRLKKQGEVITPLATMRTYSTKWKSGRVQVGRRGSSHFFNGSRSLWPPASDQCSPRLIFGAGLCKITLVLSPGDVDQTLHIRWRSS